VTGASHTGNVHRTVGECGSSYRTGSIPTVRQLGVSPRFFVAEYGRRTRLREARGRLGEPAARRCPV